MRDKTKTKQAKAKKASKFITLPNGALVRRSAVVAVEMHPGSGGRMRKSLLSMKPYVSVTYGDGNSLGWVNILCESVDETKTIMRMLQVLLA